MDGTLTPPRKKVESEIIKSLKDLSSVAKIGIVTGSGFDYLIQQCQDIWYDIGSVDPSKIVLMPCNGTQVYKWNGKSFKKESSVNMREKMGDKNFNLLMSGILRHQFLYTQVSSDMPLTGHHVSYRESLVNWCPIGRNANDDQRKVFVKHDEENGVRKVLKTLIEKFSKDSGLEDIVFALGGSTSIDIYPTGWDKTYSLKHFEGETCWFVGDKCTDDGNDRTIYEELLGHERSFQTTGPEQTVEIISQIKKSIESLIKEESKK